MIENKIAPDRILAGGVRALREEARGLELLAGSLGPEFVRAVELLLSLDGRVAVTGMGKSGHVARKAASTLASTGTPAYFIHPAEAGHGDLGMISPRDAVLAFSNSGATEELASILTFCARHQVPVIGVTKNPNSFLGSQSRLVLALPDLPEACPLNSAPTTSTTMMMALGDALALCLLEAKGFTPEHFHQYHPGGSLGRRLLAVRDIMHTGDRIPLVTPDRTMPEVLYTITGKSLGCTGVIDGKGGLIGIITDGDLRRHMTPKFLELTAADIMTPDPATIGPDTLAAQALGQMQRRSITALFVVEEGGAADRPEAGPATSTQTPSGGASSPAGSGPSPVGIIHIHDCLRAGLE